MTKINKMEIIISNISDEIIEQFYPNQVKQKKPANFYSEVIQNITMVLIFIFAWTGYNKIQLNYIMIIVGLIAFWRTLRNSNISWGKWVFFIILIGFVLPIVLDLNFQPLYNFINKLLTIFLGLIFINISIIKLFNKFNLKKEN